MLLEIIDITLPVFLLALIGFVWARMGIAFELEFVSRMVLNFALPCLIFATLVEADITPQALAEIAAAAFAAYVVAGVAMWVVLRLTGLSPRIWWTASVFGNTGNIGLPLCYFAFGDQGLALGVVVFAIAVCLQFTLGVWAIAGASHWRQVLRQPIVHASWLGCLAAQFGLELPQAVLRSLDLAGQIAIPVMLITLGFSISKLKLGETGQAALVAVLRLAVLAGAALAVTAAVGLGPVASAIIVLQFTTPGAVTVYMMATKYNGAPESIAGLVLISTVLTLAVAPVALSFLL
ncbi:MAG: AEC family transporter [Pseudomonadota bacterium]